jgi:hypothetical protein
MDRDAADEAQSSPSGKGTTTDLREAYLEYLRTAGKYLDRALDPRRLRAYAAAYSRVAAAADDAAGTAPASVQRGRRAYRLALSEFADWLPEEVSAWFPSFPLNTSTVLSSFSLDDAARRERGGYFSSRLLLQSRTDEDQQHPQQHDEAMYLNWATSDNPLGYSVVSPVHNQGACGACWAFVAAGSTEGSVRIAQAQAQTVAAGPGRGRGASATASRGDVSAAGPPPPLSLSVQELIDCDRGFNRGCAGGNPMHAYQYIMAFGLGEWADYPYKTQQVRPMLISLFTVWKVVIFWFLIPSKAPSCLRDAPMSSRRGSSSSSASAYAASSGVEDITSEGLRGNAGPEVIRGASLREGSTPPTTPAAPRRVTIDSYAVIPPNNEALLMRYVEKGPVAIGICGTDPELLLYAGRKKQSQICACLQLIYGVHMIVCRWHFQLQFVLYYAKPRGFARWIW